VVNASDAVLNIEKMFGNTPLHLGINLAVAEITNSDNYDPELRQIINIATDGGQDHPGSLPKALAEAARDAAIAAGIDEIHAEGIGDIPYDKDGWADVVWLQNRIVHNGWVYIVGVDAGKYKEAICHKVAWPPTPPPTPTPTPTLPPLSGRAGGGGCFIATAAYGTPLAEEIEVLRQFRDEYLLTNPPGRLFVSVYYRSSPPLADFIDDHPALKPMVRAGLSPTVALTTVAVNTTSAEKIAIVGSLALISILLTMWRRQRSRRLGRF